MLLVFKLIMNYFEQELNAYVDMVVTERNENAFYTKVLPHILYSDFFKKTIYIPFYWIIYFIFI